MPTAMSGQYPERSRSNSALVSDICAAAFHAFCNAPQRER